MREKEDERDHEGEMNSIHGSEFQFYEVMMKMKIHSRLGAFVLVWRRRNRRRKKRKNEW